MHTLRVFTLFSLLFFGCDQAPKNTTPAGAVDCISLENEDITGVATCKTVRGALLGTRFASLEELKSVIQIEYHDGAGTSNDGAFVRVRHCSSGREVVSVLEAGIHQGAFLKARHEGAYGAQLNILLNSPYAVTHRKELEKMYTLSRWRPERFGEGDLAFFDIAKLTAGNINTPELAFKNPRDSTEKGYLNSFNHITTQAFITTCYSEELADFIADTHERYLHPELITGTFTEALVNDLEEGPVDNYVDMINNEWGQELGKQLKAKYGINSETDWTPELLANYLNDLQSYYSWAFQIGFKPYRPEDDVVIRFSEKIDAVMKGLK